MDRSVRRNIVVSAVNVRKGGTLTILRDCLLYLSKQEQWHVTALVHKRKLCDFPGIDYIEIPWTVGSWAKRIKCEYFSMEKISKQLQPVDLWLSLHDTTPRVEARRQAVYCHNSFPFLRATLQDFRMDRKIPLFTIFTRFAYRINLRRNYRLIVQTRWMRESLSKLLHYPAGRIVVAPPAVKSPAIEDTSAAEAVPIFIYPSTPDCHKNVETICRAAKLLEGRLGTGKFRLVLTISGEENKYAKWLYDSFDTVGSIEFNGYMPRDVLFRYYGRAAGLIFPSRVETWGLPVSEFLPTGKPMLLADEKYAHEAAAGAAQAAFFPTTDAEALARLMEEVISGSLNSFVPVPKVAPGEPRANGWDELFDLLLEDL